MLRKLIRGIITLCGGLLGYGVSFLFRGLIIVTNLGDVITLSESQKDVFSIICAVLTAIIFFIIAPTIGKHGQKVAKDIEYDLQKIPSTEIVPGTFGLVVGLFLAYLISQLYMGIQLPFVATVLSVLTYLLLGYIGVFVATKRGKEILTLISSSRKASTSKSKDKVSEAAPKILDTSVIIDGRIADICNTGFIASIFVIVLLISIHPPL